MQNKTVIVEKYNKVLCVSKISNGSSVSHADNCQFQIELKKTDDSKYYFEVVNSNGQPNQVFNIFGNMEVKTYVKRSRLQNEEKFSINILTDTVVIGSSSTYKITYN